MKRIITLSAIALVALTVNARIAGSVSGKISLHVGADMHKPFLHTSVDLENGMLTFSRLPFEASCMYLLDEQGQVSAKQDVTRNNNKVKVKQLRPGTYTVVLKQHNATKMFSCQTDIVVKSKRGHHKDA